MKIIVDAYNVLHQVIKSEKVNEAERKQFINMLAVYAKKTKHELVVVFDAGPVLFATSTQQKGITVKYSGPKDSADDLILRYIKEHKGQTMLLVSSDRALCQAAGYYEVEALDAKDFYDLLTERSVTETKKKPAQAIKMGTRNSIMDTLIDQIEVPKKIDDMEDPLHQRASPGRKSSKKERKRMHKLKKL